LLRKKPSLFILVLTSLLLGMLTGLFFDEGAASLKVIGDAYIDLLQMPVVPYVVVSLMSVLAVLIHRHRSESSRAPQWLPERSGC